MSRSYSNLFELASGDAPLPSSGFSRGAKKLSRVATVPGILSELDDEGFSSDAPSSVTQERMIIVGNQLPLRVNKRPDGSWVFSWDEDSLLLQLRDGLGEDVEIMYVGCLREDIDPKDQDDVAQHLLENFKCVPARYALGLSYQSKAEVIIGLVLWSLLLASNILPVGLHLATTTKNVVDDMDIFKGISLKLLAFGEFADSSIREKRVNVVLGSNANRSGSREGCSGGIAYYVNSGVVCDSCPGRENFDTYEYIICRQGNAKLDETLGLNPSFPKKEYVMVSNSWGAPLPDFYWKQIAEPVMKLYTETTDGSTIETKESGLVWNYQYADPDFGSCQAKELLDHLESVLANEPVTVKSGQNIVEVKSQGINKGIVADRLLTTMKDRGMIPDFVLCIGDDRSDEDMFEAITRATAGPSLSPVAEVFACTVGRKPSKARYFLEDPTEILRMLQGLASVSEHHSLKNISKGFPKVVIE
ncbi:glycosyl transferase, family 20 [Artemisia annua]|uniref:Trehalose 6-phosphate phosphatase n=1 Tax=Artemisia annua TaxID=35608 RepID=A0A2U1QD99_ARTAN|nr:glycosyl transferase, family 20 [Artemisia annua]